MARFGKKAELDSQKKMTDVEVVVSVYDDGCYKNAAGETIGYYVEAQRLQDEVSEEDAKAGKADSNPYLTSKKEKYKDSNGQIREKVSHVQQITAYGMDQIKAAAANCFDVVQKYTNPVTGEEKERIQHNYVVKVRAGLDMRANTGFFFVPKAVNATEKDEKYSKRAMPKTGRVLTEDILEKHRKITEISKEFYKNSGESTSEGALSEQMSDSVVTDIDE